MTFKKAVSCLLGLFTISAIATANQPLTTLPAISCQSTTGPDAVVSCQIDRPGIKLSRLGTFRDGIHRGKGSEILQHDPLTQVLVSINGGERNDCNHPSKLCPSLDFISIRDPRNPVLVKRIDLKNDYDDLPNSQGATPTSVAVRDGLIALTMRPENKFAGPGKVVFLNVRGDRINEVQVGNAPDMITFSPDGHYVVTADVGEWEEEVTLPDSSMLLRTSISVVNVGDKGLGASAKIIGFEELIDRSEIRYSFYTSPEYVAFDKSGETLFVNLQTNNAIAVMNFETLQWKDVFSLGLKDHSKKENALDPSDRDGVINIRTIKGLFGMYQPDGFTTFEHNDQTFLMTANEGDDINRTERVRAADLILDPKAFPNAAELQMPENLGRLRVSKIEGDPDGDGDQDWIQAYGTRSFSIYNANGKQVWDSGDQLARLFEAAGEPFVVFNTGDDTNQFEDRSDDGGAEPENVTIGEVDGRRYAFGILSRPGGVVIYDIQNPQQPKFQQYINHRDFTLDAKTLCQRNEPESETCAEIGDLGPESVIFIKSEDSPIGQPLVVTGNETSSSATVYLVTHEHHADDDNEH